MSKTHARLELRDGTWIITDLDSTNGVVLIDVDGTEIEVASGRPMPIVERFLLGDAELSVTSDTD
ncbi:FHA domain-containing protein [Microbacterium elymi]|uniref:FHA domain-containing protein n=1 Tax=Microbacterium elymi TaxID=2909587 RepID=A0ABY5NL57_9MICO|nr:FHA domain-containing protein [Microbacterium elymi]UUT35916.1 FHA domain-containing protein [Microbacterium elymi]